MTAPDAVRLARLEAEVEWLTYELDRLKADQVLLRAQVRDLAAQFEQLDAEVERALGHLVPKA